MRINSLLCPLLVLLLLPLATQSRRHSQLSPANNNGKDGDALKLVILIHRHGDRSPIQSYPRDPYRNASYWPDGWGELTIKGKNRMYKLGKYLARRYTGFLGQSGPNSEVYIRSSGSDRCLQSVALIMAGLYPPQARWKWDEDLGSRWQPFPIQTVPHDYDGMLNPDSYCKRGKEEIEKVYSSPLVKQYVKTIQPTLDYVKDNTGLPEVDIIKAEQVFDSLLIEKEYNLKLPSWVDRHVYTQLQEISDKSFVFSAMNREVQRLRTGLLLKEIIENFAKPDFGGKRLYVYSTHDTQLSVFLSALDVYNGLAPPFGSAVMLEIYQNQTDEPYLRTFYLNDTASERPIELELKSCPQTWTNGAKKAVCTLTSFQQTVGDLIPGDWEEECRNVSEVSADAISVYILTITLFITLCVLMVFIYLFLHTRRHVTFYKMLPVN